METKQQTLQMSFKKLTLGLGMFASLEVVLFTLHRKDRLKPFIDWLCMTRGAARKKTMVHDVIILLHTFSTDLYKTHASMVCMISKPKTMLLQFKKTIEWRVQMVNSTRDDTLLYNQFFLLLLSLHVGVQHTVSNTAWWAGFQSPINVKAGQLLAYLHNILVIDRAKLVVYYTRIIPYRIMGTDCKFGGVLPYSSCFIVNYQLYTRQKFPILSVWQNITLNTT